MLNAHLAQLARRWVYRIRRPDDRQPARRPAGLRLEAVEERLAPAVVPTPSVIDTRTVFTSNVQSNGFAPQAAIDPTDPQKQVLAYANGNGIQLQFSSDGGQTWTRVFNNADPTDFNSRTTLRLADPTFDPATVNGTDRQWQQATTPDVAFGRGGRVYLTHVQKTNDSTRGVLLVDVFDFSGTTLVDVIRNKIVTAWNGNDPAFNPTVTVDNNTATGGLNPGAGRGAVYIAWNTNADAPNGQTTGFNPTAVLMSASSDGGQTFSAPFFVSSNQFFGSGANGNNNFRMVAPQIAVAPSQPAGSFTSPGQVSVAYNTVGAAAGSDIFINNAQLTPSVAGGAGFFTVDASGTTGTIFESNLDKTALANDYTAQVSIPSDSRNTRVTGVTVNVSLKHPGLNQLRLELIAPDGSVVTLLQNRLDVAGQVISDQIGLGGGDAIGFVRAAKSFGSSFGGRFTETAPRRINDGNTKAPYNADMRPEDSFSPGFGGLAGFEGDLASNLAGEWTLRVTDFQSKNADAKNPQQVLGWSLNITGGLGDETFDGDNFVVAGQGGSLQAGDPLGGSLDGLDFPNKADTKVTTIGFGPNVSIAYDTSIGGPNSGNLYVAYSGGGSATVRNFADGKIVRDPGDIYFMRSTDGGRSFLTAEGFFRPFTGIGLLNTDSFTTGGDNYSQGNRTQFQPTLTVDQQTGTLMAMWYDARNDASDSRVASYIAASIDGGLSFSDQTYQFTTTRDQALTPEINSVPGRVPVTATPLRQPFLNDPKTAYDATDVSKGVLIEPVPSNGGLANTPAGFGQRQALLAFGGKVFAYWAGNANAGENKDAGRAAVQVFTATAIVAAGPRVVTADMGPVVNPTGRPTLDGFTLVFDRPIDPTSFTPASVRVGYTPGDQSTVSAGGAGTPPGTPVMVAAVERNPFDPTRFFVRFQTQQTGVGAYSYYIDSGAIRDTITSPIVTVVGGDLPELPAIPSSGTSNNIPVPAGGTAGTFPGGYDDATRSAGAVSTIAVPALPAGQAVGRVIVTVNVSSTAGNDLVINLVSPTGTRVSLISRAGFAGFPSQFINTTLDDNAARSVQDPFIVFEDSDYTGTFIPFQSTRILAGESAQGLWRLEVTDVDGNPSISTLQDWSIQIVPTLLGPSPINLMDQNANGSVNEPNFVDGFAAPGRLGDNQTAFVGGLDAKDTYPLVIPGPRLLGTVVPGRPFVAGSETLYQDVVPGKVDLVFDRPINAGTFSKDQVVRITGPLGVIFDAVTLAADKLLPPNQVSTAGKANIASYNALTVTPVAGDTTRFTVGFTTQQASGSYSVQVASSVADSQGFQLDNNANAGVARVYRNAAFANSFTSTTYSSKAQTPNGIAIPAGTVANPSVTELPLAISDAGTIASGTDLNGVLQRVLLRLDITYPNDPDLTADLVPPANSPITTPIRLFSGVGARGGAGGTLADFRNTLFDDTSNSPIQLGSPPFDNTGTGAFTPQFPLNDLSRFGVGVQGTWTLRITNVGTRTGRLNYYNLTLPTAVVGSGVGEATADRGTGTFRVFNIDPTANPDAAANPLSERQWTPVGPAAIGQGGNGAASRSSRTTGLAVDPSDPSGNTVYVGAASGGVWKTTNFLDPTQEPTYIPLTDFGPATSLNVGGIEAIGRNNDPNRTMLFVATGEGDTGSPGVGFLFSPDAGRTWRVLDSSVNVDLNQASQPFLSPTDPTRDRIFVGATSFKVVADPVPQPNGEFFLYAAISGGRPGANGVWRSRNTGKTWERIQAGNATDVHLALGTAPTRPNPGGTGTIRGNAEVLYAAFRGFGVFLTPSATGAAAVLPGAADGTGSMNLLANAVTSNQLLRDFELANEPALLITAPTETPNGAKGRLSISGPALTGDPRLDLIYSGWLYAVVSETNDSLDGIYVTKDFGANWSRVQIPFFDTSPGFLGGGVSTLNKTQPDNPLFGGNGFGQGNYDIAIAVDPNNPAVIYVGGSQNGAEVFGGGYVRVDTSFLSDTQNLTAYSNSQGDTNGVQFSDGKTDANQGPARVKTNPPGAGPGSFYGLRGDDPAFPGTFPFDFDFSFVNIGSVNVARDPINPLLGTNSTLYFTNMGGATQSAINNTGFGAKWQPFFGEVTTDVHRILTMKDPLTGKTRIITADDQGTATVVDNGDGSFDFGIGRQAEEVGLPLANATRTGQFQPSLFRNGNLQINQFYQGAVQPSQLAADIAGSLFYGSSQDNGSPRSTFNLVATGDLRWEGPGGDATGVATDSTGSGTAYQYRWPCCGGGLSDFYRVLVPQGPAGQGTPPLDVGRTNGLVQPGDDIRAGTGNWRFVGGSNIAVNPIDGQGLLVSGNVSGRVFRSTNQGATWFSIAEPAVTGGSYAPALAFGAPPVQDQGLLNNYVLMGTQSGRTFVTFTGTFSGPQTAADGTVNWREIAVPNDGSSVRQIVANPRRGFRDAYMVTFNNVYHIQDTRDPAQNWVNVTGNLFDITKPIYFGDPSTDASQALLFLETIAADWRFANPIGGPTDTAPTLYVGGMGGVFRSTNRGGSWTYFPDMATDAATADGGFLPAVHVTDLDLSIGNIDPVSGLPRANGSLNLLVASTFGRGSWAIRLDTTRPNNVVFVSGPKVAANGGIQNPNPTFVPGVQTTSNQLVVLFDSAVDPTSFDPADVTLLDPTGNPVTITGVTPVNNPDFQGVDQRNKFVVTFASQTRLADGTGMFGKYTFSIGVDVYDFAGNKLNQNANTVNGENPADVFTRAIILNDRATSIVISGLPAQIVAGTPTAYTVRIENGADGSLVSNYAGRVTFTVTPPGNPQDVVPVSYTFTGIEGGSKTLSLTLTKAGPQTLSAVATNGDANTAAVNTVVIAAPATQFVVSNFPNTTAGVGKAFSLEAQDQFGNVDKQFTGTVALSSPNDPSFTATLNSAPNTPLVPANTYTFASGDQGRVDFFGTFTKAGTDRIISINGPGTVDGQITNIVVAPDVAKSLTVSGALPAIMTAGVASNLTLQALDQFGNVAANPTTAAFAFPTDPIAPAISPVTFTGSVSVPVEFRKAANPQTVTISDPNGVLTGTSASTKVVANVVTQFGVSGFPSSVTAGKAKPVTVTALDAFGNTNTTFTGKADLGGSDGNQGTVTFQAGGGGVAIGNTFLTKAGTGRFVSATAGAVTGKQVGITVLADTANRLDITPLPDPYTAGAPVLLTATAFDRFGNVDTGFRGTVTLTSTDPQAVLDPVVYSYLAGDNGAKTFTVALKTAGVRTVSVEPDSSTVQGGETTVTVRPGAATTFQLSGFPQNVQVGVAKTLTVSARDAFGNLASDYAGTVVFASSDAKAVLPGPSGLSGGTGSFPVTLNTPGTQSLTVTDSADTNIFGVQPGITVPQPPPPPPEPPPPPPPPQNVLLVGTPEFAVGADAGLTPSVRLFNADDRSERYSLTAFDPLFTGGVRTAAGDLNGDGVSEMIVSTGPGIVTRVQAFDGVTQKLLLDFQPFEDTFTQGVYVAVGDVTGDGKADIVVTPDQGGGPRVDVYSGATFAKVASFFGITDPDFRGGARAAVGDINGDGTGDLLVSAGFGGGPRIAGFNGTTIATNTPVKLFADFFAFESTLRNGAFVAAGDVDGDGKADLVFGGGPGGGPRVSVLSGASILRNQQAVLANFFGGDTASRGGIRVAVKDVDGDKRADILVGAGVGAGTRVTGYLGKNLTAAVAPVAFDLDALPTFDGGVFVG